MSRKVAPKHFDISLTKQKFNLVEAKDPRNNWNPKESRMKRIVNFITDIFSGENKVGEALHGVLDLFPIPNQIIAKVFAYIKSGKTDKARDELKKLVSFRNIVALIVFILILIGVISVDDAQRLIDVLS